MEQARNNSHQLPDSNIPINLKKFTIDDFEVGAKLGNGRFGDVYLAREKKSSYIVALKILNKKVRLLNRFWELLFWKIWNFGWELHVITYQKLFSMFFLIKKEIKRLNAEKLVVREIKIHSFLDHPNIIKLFGVFHDKHKIYLILEYAPDSELYSEIKNQVYLTSH